MSSDEFVHLERALRAHRERVEHNGGSVPSLCLAFEELVRLGVLSRQEPTTFAKSEDPAQPAVVTPRLLTYADAAKALAFSERTVERLVSQGKIPVVAEGRAKRIRVEDLDDYIASKVRKTA